MVWQYVWLQSIQNGVKILWLHLQAQGTLHFLALQLVTHDALVQHHFADDMGCA